MVDEIRYGLVLGGGIKIDGRFVREWDKINGTNYYPSFSWEETFLMIHCLTDLIMKEEWGMR